MADPQRSGAGRYRVRKGQTLIYRGIELGEGEELDMSDAGAGVHYRKVERVSEKAAREKAEAEAKKRAAEAKKRAAEEKPKG